MLRIKNDICFAVLILLLGTNSAPAQESTVQPAPHEFDSGSRQADRLDIIRPPSMPVDQTAAERELYDSFIESLANGSYSEADVAAKRMVTLALEHADDNYFAVSQALINLAVTQQLADDSDSAILNYEASISHIEQRGNLLSQRLIAPLRGLATAQYANGQPATALRTLDRALHISNVNAGPHSFAQIPLLDLMLQTRMDQDDQAGAKKMLERIHTLALREYSLGSEELLPTLIYKADVEKRLGMQLAQRETYKDIIKITARTRGNDHFSLIDTYLKIARTYVYDAEGFFYRSLPTAPTAEWYYKKAIAIADSNPDADVLTKSTCLLALADYYTIAGVYGKAHSLYAQTWDLLSAEESRHAQRNTELAQLKALSKRRPHNYANFGYKSDIHEAKPEDLLSGAITLSYTVSEHGTTKDVEIIAADPAGFEQMELRARQAIKKFVFRPRLVDGMAIESPDQRYRHDYFYRTSDLRRSGAESRGRATTSAARIN